MYLKPELVKFECPHCHELVDGFVPVTAVQTAATPGARGMLRGYGHLVVMAGTNWHVMCNKDRAFTVFPTRVTAGSAAGAVSGVSASKRK